MRYGGNSRCVAGEIRSAEEGEFDSNADCFSTLRHCTTYVHCMCKCHVHFHSTKQPRAQVFQIFPTKLISPPEKNFLLCKLIGCLASALLNATKLHYRNVQRENQGGEDSQENKKIWKADIKSISWSFPSPPSHLKPFLKQVPAPNPQWNRRSTQPLTTHHIPIQPSMLVFRGRLWSSDGSKGYWERGKSRPNGALLLSPLVSRRGK